MNPDPHSSAPVLGPGAAVVDEQAIDGAGIGCWTIDVASDVSRYSPKWAAQLGYGLGDFQQVPGNWRLMIHRDDLPGVAAAVDDVIAGRSPTIDQEMRVRRRNGSWQWVRSFGQVSHRDGDGRPLTLSGIHADISARVLAARALEHRERRLRLVLTAGDEGWWDWDLISGRFEFGDYWAGLLGQPLATLHPGIDTWLDRVHPDDIARLRAALDDACQERSTLLDIEHRIIDADGRSRWLMARGRIVERDEDSDCARRMAGVLVDISERKRADLALARSTALVQAVQSLQQRFIAQPDLRQLGHELLATLLDFGEAEYGFIGEVLHDPQGAPYLKTFTLTNIAWNPEMQALYEAHHREGLEFRNLDTLFGHTLRTGELVIANKPDEHPSARGLPKGHPALNTYAGVPIHDGQQLIGMVGLGNRTAGFDDSVLDLIRPLTATIAVMLKSVRLERDRAARADELLRVSMQAVAAEARLRDITDGLPAAVFQFSFGGSRLAHFSFVSRAIQQIVGTGPDLLTSRPKLFLKRVLAEDRRKLLYTLERCRESTNTVQLSFRLRDAGGTPRWLEATISRGHGNDSRAVWNGFLFDVSERKRSERELLQARDAADAANRAKSSFIATISHEIRTPLHGVLGLIELMKLAPVDAGQADNLRLVESSGKSLLRLIDDLLDFSRMERGQLEIRSEPTPLREEVTRTASFWNEAARAKGVPLILDIAAEVPRMVSVDALRLRQILDNLLSNAIKFTASGSIRLGLAVLAPLSGQRASSCRLAFTVADTGIGIGSQAQARLFRPFVQADHATARQFGGSGLGLSISRGLAERMGGTLTLESQLGHGTTMHLQLPLSSLDEPSRAQIAADAGGLRPPSPDLQHQTVLVAEDHAVNRKLISQQLAHLGYTAWVADSGEQALAIWRQGDCSLLLTDCHMPGMDGFELARAIRAEEQQRGLQPIPIIACTADVYAGIVETCLAAGMNGWIGKPVSLEALRLKLAKWLGERRPALTLAAAPAEIKAAETASAAPAAPAEPPLPPLLDAAALDRLTGGDQLLGHDLLAAFADSLADERSAVRRALDSGQADALRRSLHRLLGACRSACVPRLVAEVEAMQALARRGDAAALASHWPTLAAHIDDTAAAIAAQTGATVIQAGIATDSFSPAGLPP